MIAEGEKSRSALKVATEELTKTSVAYSDLKKHFTTEECKWQQSVKDAGRELELSRSEVERCKQEIQELKEKADTDAEMSRVGIYSRKYFLNN